MIKHASQITVTPVPFGLLMSAPLNGKADIGSEDWTLSLLLKDLVNHVWKETRTGLLVPRLIAIL